jgi:hypothetical protein
LSGALKSWSDILKAKVNIQFEMIVYSINRRVTLDTVTTSERAAVWRGSYLKAKVNIQFEM